jgi:hypothetical protein
MMHAYLRVCVHVCMYLCLLYVRIYVVYVWMYATVILGLCSEDTECLIDYKQK